MGLLSNPKNRQKAVRFISNHSNKLCFLSYVGGVAWFLALAYRPLNAGTYFSENALLPGLVDADFFHDFGASKVYHGLRDELRLLKEAGGDQQYRIPAEFFERQFRSVGLDTYVQNFTFQYPASILQGEKFPGSNVYGILRAPRCASTEAIVISAPYRPPEGERGKTNHGIAMMIGLAKAFRRHSYWAKDVIFLITEHEQVGMQAWLDAYHGQDSPYIAGAELFGRSGAIQAALNVEIGSENVNKMSLMLEGLNGQLPNLDLVNTVVKLCRRESMVPAIHKRRDYWNPESYEGWKHNLITMATMMWHQLPGSPTANHGLFHRYNIEAVTMNGVSVKTGGRSYSYIEVGRIIEGVVRSLNNLLERFHQSFFFYLLPSTERYVSIGLYMPPFGLMAAPILIKALALWIDFCFEGAPENEDENSGKESEEKTKKEKEGKSEKKEEKSDEKEGKRSEAGGDTGDEEKSDPKPKRSSGFFSISPSLIMAMFFGLISYNGAEYAVVTSNAFQMAPGEGLLWGAFALTASSSLFPIMLKRKTKQKKAMTGPNMTLLRCVAFLTLGATLGTVALMNISFAVFITVIWVPVLLFSGPSKYRFVRIFSRILLLMVSPLGLMFGASVTNQLMAANFKNLDFFKIFDGSLENLKQILVMGVVESHLIGNWTYGIVTVVLVPVWLMFWAVTW